MSAEIQDSNPAIRWWPSLREPGLSPGTLFSDWLTYEGLLTARLKSTCQAGFRLQLLGPGPGLLVDRNDSRRVVMWCGDHPCVYGESHLPAEALSLVPSLRNLGSDPLGEALRTHQDVSRTPFEFALLQGPELPAEVGCADDTPLWARRSSFVIGAVSLPVAEVFLPGIEGLPR